MSARFEWSQGRRRAVVLSLDVDAESVHAVLVAPVLVQAVAIFKEAFVR